MTINVTKIFRALLFLSPIVVAANINMDIFDLIFFRTGVMVLFMASLLDIPKREMPSWVNKIVFFLLGLCLFNLFNFQFAQTILANTFNLFIGVLGFYLVYRYCDADIDLKKPIAWAFIINLILYTAQRFGIDPVYDHISEGGFMGNAARMGIYSALITPFLPFMLIIAGVVLMFFIKQYTILIPIVIGLFLKAKSKKNKVLIIIGACIAGLILKKHIISEFAIRINELWIPILDIYFDKPLLGIGFGQNHVVGPNIGVYLNSYLQFIVGVGILGLVWFIYTFKVIHKEIKLNFALLTLGLVMCIEYPIEIPRFWFLIIAILVNTLLCYKGDDRLCDNITVG